MYYGGAEAAVHADLSDAAQTVYVPRIDTTAIAEETGDHVSGPDEQLALIDRVDYSGLEAGRKYTVRGELYDRESGESLGITAEDSFTAEASEGYRELFFSVDASAMAGRTIVAFETLYTEEKEVAVHHDLSDEDQSVHIPSVETDAADAESGLNHIEASGTAGVIDTVTYVNLVPAKEYTVRGELYDKQTGESIGVTAETTFTPGTPDGTVEILFAFDASGLGGKTLVTFETLYIKDVEIAVHADIDDGRQTIYVPKISTDAKNDETGTHEGTVNPQLSVTDFVTYANLIPGREYTLKGILMDKASGEPLSAGGAQVTAEKTFTPGSADGTVGLSFTFDSTAIGGKTAVVFETLYCEGAEIAVHADIEDRNQAIIFPGIGTEASDASSGADRLTSDRIRDDIFYTGLTPGAEYVIVTQVYDKKAKALTDAKTEIPFSPEDTDGTVTVCINVDASDLKLHQLVVFEEIWLVTKDGRVLAASHEDPDDKAQTVTVPGYAPPTGDASNIMIPAAVMAAAGLGIAVIGLGKRRR